MGTVASYSVPIGISFFVFGQISFVVDRRHNKKLQDVSYLDFIKYSFFFPVFSSGPIVRMSSYFEKNGAELVFNSRRTTEGLLLIFSGIFKKFCVADNISNFTVLFYNPNSRVDGVDYFIPFILSKYEIFANFSGYTDIALGIGLILGFYLPENFNKPFATVSIVEFWKRWHMSLAEWIKHYVFYPLALTRFGRLGPYALMTMTFLVFAFWHGIKMTYIIYALVQVFLIYLGHRCAPFYKSFEKKLNSIILNKAFLVMRWIYFYVIIISIPGILFRVDSVAEFKNILEILSHTSLSGIRTFIESSASSLYYALAGIILIELGSHFEMIKRVSSRIQNSGWEMKVIIFYLLVFILLIAYNKDFNSGFIYSIF